MTRVMFPPLLRSTSARIAVTSLAALAASAPAAHASCPQQDAAPVFAPWGDNSLYRAVPGGDFEGGMAGWTIDGAASVVEDDSPLASGAHALELAPGAAVTTPPICVDAQSRTARMFVKTVTTAAGARLGVEVELANGFTPVTGLRQQESWTASPRLPLPAGGVIAGSADGTAWVRLRFSASGAATWRVDDVYVDPRMW
jgi:hypothetical protein